MRLASFPDSEEAQRAAMLVEYSASSTRTGSQYRIVVTCALKSPYNLRELARELVSRTGTLEIAITPLKKSWGFWIAPRTQALAT